MLPMAAAAALLATSANAQSIRISTQGKTADQIRAEVVKAAESLCWRETVGASFPVDARRLCVDATVKATFAQAPGLGLTLAQR
ncbi:hypothetical protein [Phenylobacterium soli]